MMKKQRKPAWQFLDGLVLLLAGLLFGVHRLHLATGMETLSQILLVLAFYSLMALWLRANGAALAREEREKKKLRAMDPQLNLTEIQAHYRQTTARSGEQRCEDNMVLMAIAVIRRI
jgi:TM2 domain-containing membrane protein YozV